MEVKICRSLNFVDSLSDFSKGNKIVCKGYDITTEKKYLDLILHFDTMLKN